MFAGAGSVLMITGAIVGGDYLDGLMDPQDQDNTKLPGLLFHTGLSVAAVSIPLLIFFDKLRN